MASTNQPSKSSPQPQPEPSDDDTNSKSTMVGASEQQDNHDAVKQNSENQTDPNVGAELKSDQQSADAVQGMVNMVPLPNSPMSALSPSGEQSNSQNQSSPSPGGGSPSPSPEDAVKVVEENPEMLAM